MKYAFLGTTGVAIAALVHAGIGYALWITVDFREPDPGFWGYAVKGLLVSAEALGVIGFFTLCAGLICGLIALCRFILRRWSDRESYDGRQQNPS